MKIETDYLVGEFQKMIARYNAAGGSAVEERKLLYDVILPFALSIRDELIKGLSPFEKLKLLDLAGEHVAEVDRRRARLESTACAVLRADETTVERLLCDVVVRYAALSRYWDWLGSVPGILRTAVQNNEGADVPAEHMLELANEFESIATRIPPDPYA